MAENRSIPNVAGVVRLDDFLNHLRMHRSQWSMTQIAKAAKVPKSAVSRALAGKNVNKKTLRAIAAVFGGELLVALKENANRLVDET